MASERSPATAHGPRACECGHELASLASSGGANDGLVFGSQRSELTCVGYRNLRQTDDHRDQWRLGSWPRMGEAKRFSQAACDAATCGSDSYSSGKKSPSRCWIRAGQRPSAPTPRAECGRNVRSARPAVPLRPSASTTWISRSRAFSLRHWVSGEAPLSNISSLPRR